MFKKEMWELSYEELSYEELEDMISYYEHTAMLRNLTYQEQIEYETLIGERNWRVT